MSRVLPPHLINIAPSAAKPFMLKPFSHSRALRVLDRNHTQVAEFRTC